VRPFTISIATSGFVLIVPLGPVVVTKAFEKLTLPKSASGVSEQVRLQISGRSTIHSAED
jgi:hypothetical protein